MEKKLPASLINLDLKLLINIKLIVKSPNKKKSNSIIKRFIHPFKGVIYLWNVFIFKKNKKISSDNGFTRRDISDEEILEYKKQHKDLVVECVSILVM